jgi:hypothetical protein
MKPNLNKKDLQKLLDETVESLTDVLAKAESEGLAKTSPGEEAPAEKTPAGSSTEGVSPEKSASDGPSEEASEAPAAPQEGSSGEGSEAGAEPQGSEVPGEAEQAMGDPAQEMGGEVSVESLQAEYQAMPVEDQKMHLLALKAALMTTLAAGQGQVPGQAPAPMQEQAPPMAPEAAMAPPVAGGGLPPALPVMKSETDPAILERLGTLEKSLKEKEEVIKGFGAVAEGLKNMLTGRKSAHSISVLSKPGDGLIKKEGEDVASLSKSEISSRLKEVIATQKLSKSDKDLIITFTAGANKDVSKIAHLLKK